MASQQFLPAHIKKQQLRKPGGSVAELRFVVLEVLAMLSNILHMLAQELKLIESDHFNADHGFEYKTNAAVDHVQIERDVRQNGHQAS